ncbi:PrsW family intramembrane metalloprotease [Candidatus Wolfebacteria bacterium]|nr:PrsW family intramembrane metalloprotease [Candidatus Wolfebacteria bacterium]
MLDLPTLTYAFLGGLLPALVWLYFWLKEDARCPEPKHLIFLAFVAGMIAVPLVIPFQKFALAHYGEISLMTIFAWAAVEELMKYGVVAVAILWRKAVNEPIDAMIYMVTAALGFAALENTLFLLSPIADGNLIDSFITGNLRFLGSTLLHLFASAIVGFAMAISFYKHKRLMPLYTSIGLILAIALHTIFNLLIISSKGYNTLNAFFFVWVGVVVILILFEVARVIRFKNRPKNKGRNC